MKKAPFILYLDFDGVLHPDAAYRDLKGRIYLKTGGELFEYAKHLSEALKPYPEVKIVLSTSWVRVKGFGKVLKRMPKDLRSRVIGATWHSYFKHDTDLIAWWENASRFQQIQKDVLRRQPTAWLALDDDVKDWPSTHRAHLIECDSDHGLSNLGTRDFLGIRLEKVFGQPQATPTLSQEVPVLSGALPKL